jgi:hypothetical protein
MDINQQILKVKNIINYIKKIIKNIQSDFNNDIEYKDFYPNKFDWYIYNIKILKKIIKEKELYKSLCNYKLDGYRLINKILIQGSYPFIYFFSDYNNDSYYNSDIKNIFNKTPINTNPIYLFPNNMKKITDLKKKKILNNINNIDKIFNKYYNELKLSDCILFRGMNINNKSYKKTFNNIFHNMIKNSEYKKINNIKLNINNDFTFKNYISTSFNIRTALNFIDFNDENPIFMIIRIKKEHNVPGIYLSNLFWEKNIDKIPSIEKNIIKLVDNESEILLNRNLTIKVIKIDNLKLKDVKKYFSISDLYKKDDKTVKNRYLKIIYAESLPYVLPETFMPKDTFKYICKEI